MKNDRTENLMKQCEEEEMITSNKETEERRENGRHDIDEAENKG